MPAVKVYLSRHASEKARRRNVTMSHIRRTLDAPDQLYEDVEHGTMIALKKTNDKTVIIAYRKQPQSAKVITLYYTTKLDKLLRAKTVRGAWKPAK